MKAEESADNPSAGLSEIMHQIDRKLDSAQRKFNPQFGGGKSQKAAADTAAIDRINEFDVDFEKEVEEQRQSLRRSATAGTAVTTATGRRTSSRNPKTPSTMERTGGGGRRSSSRKIDIDDDDDAFTPEQFKATTASYSGATAGQTTDEQGNRLSLLPGSSRPSKQRPASIDKNK